MKKFEFTGEVATLINGTILHRIKALVKINLGWITVDVGDLGGWIEKESNLSHKGNAWVWGNAQVYGDAQVCGNARVYGDARVAKKEHVLTVGPIGSRNDMTTFFNSKTGIIKVKCGCFTGTIEEFLEKVEITHGDSKHAKVYKAAAELAIAQIDTTPVE